MLGAVGALVQRSLVVGSIDLTQGTLYGHIHGEELPRVFENVTTVRKKERKLIIQVLKFIYKY